MFTFRISYEKHILLKNNALRTQAELKMASIKLKFLLKTLIIEAVVRF